MASPKAIQGKEETIIKGTVTLLRRIIDDNENIRGYEAIVEFKDKPLLKLGDVMLEQTG